VIGKPGAPDVVSELDRISVCFADGPGIIATAAGADLALGPGGSDKPVLAAPFGCVAERGGSVAPLVEAFNCFSDRSCRTGTGAEVCTALADAEMDAGEGSGGTE
jgi:hypothetical protein